MFLLRNKGQKKGIDEIKITSNFIYCFQTFRKINVATILHRKLLNSFIGKWLYYVIPIALFSINIFNMIRNRVLYASSGEFAYLNDLSNSLCLTLLYFLSYFLSGYYPTKFEEFIERGVDKSFFQQMAEDSKDKEESYLGLTVLGIILFCIGTAAGYAFYNTAKLNEHAYWICNLDKYGKIYYCFFLGITWYHSLSLLGMALLSGFIVYLVIKYQHLPYIKDDFNKNISILSAVDIVISTFSYGLFYIIGAVLFICNDKVAGQYNIRNTFYNDIPSFFLILIVTLLVILAYLPLREVFIFMKKQKNLLIDQLNGMILEEKSLQKREEIIAKRNDLITQHLIYTTNTNKITFMLSVLIPSIGVIFQGMDLFTR